ncbi:MAG: hypothetical protein [Circular genetic element sp.]|nr:MAG: hypothetical protein [Circular genetic element sp.]
MEYSQNYKENNLVSFPLKNLFNQINTKSFFIDYISVNWQMQITKFNQYDAKKAQTWFYDFFRILEERIKILKLNSPELYNIFLQKDSHYNIKIDFKGKFFKDETYSDDINHFYKWFIEFDNMFKVYWAKAKINHNYPRATISRLDLATHKEDTFLKTFTPIRSNKGENMVKYESHKTLNFFTGITIGRRDSNWTYFRAYDKRFEELGHQHCLNRFHTVDVVRKEWVLKSKFLRHNSIDTVNSFIEFFKNKKLVNSLIRKIRIGKDVILSKDNSLYKSLHDYRYNSSVNPDSIPLKEFRKAVRETKNIFLNKVKEGDEMTTTHKWNPYKNMKGLIKYIGNMKRNEFFEFQRNMLRHLESERFESCNLKSLNKNSEFIDWDQKDFEAVTNMLGILSTIKIKNVITE